MSRFQISSARRSLASAYSAFALGLVVVLLVCVSGSARAASRRAPSGGGHTVSGRLTSSTSGTQRYQAGVVLVEFRPGVSRARIRQLERGVRARELRPLIFTGSRTPAERALGRRLGASFVLSVPRGTERSTVRVLDREHRWVHYAEPNYIIGPPAGAGAHAGRNPLSPNAMAAPTPSPTPCPPGSTPPPAGSVVPNDTYFGCQWGSLNTGQTITGSSPSSSDPYAPSPGPITGIPGADDHAAQAWKVSTGSPSIVIGELDSGVDYNHPDLKTNIWSNPGNIRNPDGTQCPAGTHGYNVVASPASCDPMDDNVAPPPSYGGHGTHIAGIMGATGNNGAGVAGVNWHTTILPVKAVDSNLYGSEANLIAGMQWFVNAKQQGVNVRVVNFSPVSDNTPNDPLLVKEIQVLGQNGILFVTAAGGAITAAGNVYNGADDDTHPHYPCNYDLANEICVASSDQHDHIPVWSDYGPTSVDLAAPGDNILSTLTTPTGTPEASNYGYISGTSMSAAQVSGAAALVLSVKTMSMSALKTDILGTVDPLPAPYNTKVKTGGRLDICAATPGCASPIQTATAVHCTPTSATVGQSTTCTATAADTDPSIIPPPRGTATFTSNSSGSFAPVASCTLSPGSGNSASCSVTYTPSAVGSGTHTITASYGGDASHAASSRTAALTVTAPASTGGAGGGGGAPGGGGGGAPGGHGVVVPPTILLPVNLARPAISGPGRPGRVLTCSTGRWANAPTAFRYRWSRDGATIPGARFARYRVRVLDESTRLRCTVMASDAAGSRSASSGGGRFVAIPGTLACPKASGQLRGARLGRLALGMTRARARHELPRLKASPKLVDSFCLYGGAGIRAAYLSRSLQRELSGRARRALSGRIVLAVTANLHYAVRGVRAGTSLKTARRRLKLRRIGHTAWYQASNVVLQARRGVVQQIGVADRALLRTAAERLRLVRSFDLQPSGSPRRPRLVFPSHDKHRKHRR